jgi:hypothetical protein
MYDLAHPARSTGDEDDPALLPKGARVETVLLVKHLAVEGAETAAIVAKTGLPRDEIAKIKGGAYDKAVKNSRSAVAFSRDAKARRIEHGEAAEPLVATTRLEDRPAPSDMTPDEEAWLSHVQRG